MLQQGANGALGVPRVPADIGLHGAILMETHPLYRDSPNIPAFVNRAVETVVAAGCLVHIRTLCAVSNSTVS